MIAVDFEYYQAFSITEAVGMFQRLRNEGKSPIFFNGGTEIITMMRMNKDYMDTRAVIDLKTIPECSVLEFQDDHLVIGSAIPLAQLEELRIFPLLRKNCSRIADHTSREKITIGGNICGNIKYKEAILPLLLTDCDLVVAGKSGVKQIPINQTFDQQVNLDPGSFIVQILVDKQWIDLPFVSKKMTRIGRIGYPLFTVSGIQKEGQVRFAFSGLCEFPFRSSDVEETLNRSDQSLEKRITEAISQLPAPLLDDIYGSAAYRAFVLRHVLEESLLELKGDGNGR
ncbi:FAD binding domain-containing protein [Lentibacillus sp. L22]|uniref:FAD binding domain-containing protein n=1 Tax=Lentibacillus sp. L22 TaxID=3163028 RepID=UPI0034656BBB